MKLPGSLAAGTDSRSREIGGPGSRLTWLQPAVALAVAVLLVIAWAVPASATSRAANLLGTGHVTGQTGDPNDVPAASGAPGVRGELRPPRTPMPILALLAPGSAPIALSTARVSVFELQPSGGVGRRLGTATTGNRGAASVRLLAVPARVLVKVTGGRTTRSGRAFGAPFRGSLSAIAIAAGSR